MVMGKNKTVAKKCLKRKSEEFFSLLFFKNLGKKFSSIFVLFLLFFISFNTLIVKAENIQPDFNLTFYRDLKEIEFGAIDAEKIDWSISIQTGLIDSVVFDVYDVNGNKIQSGTNGSIRMDKNYFPIKFVARTQSTGDWRVTISITKTVGQKDYSGVLSGISDKLSGISDLLDSILSKLKDIDDYLSNPKYLENGLNDLKESTERLENYRPVSSNVVSGVGSLGSISSGGGLSFNVEILPGYTINALDLSQFSGIISSIRMLMTSILWIELAMFFIRIFVPKLKV